ncbi:MAG: class I SAM-dependent methyltransferase [Haloarculaceae archaeon]
MTADPLGRTMLDYQRGRHRGNCYHRDGDAVADANVAGYYFRPSDAWPAAFRSLLASLDGPVLDAGCGAGQHALVLQRDREVIAVDASPGAVRAARERGVADARAMDAFDLDLGANAVRSILVNGTQAGLAGSLPALGAFLDDLARVAAGGGTAVVDSYDLAREQTADLLGYRPDPRAGLARRTFHVEYEYPIAGGWTREVGPTLSFLLFGPDRLREAARETPWSVTEVRRRGGYYRAVLEQ